MALRLVVFLAMIVTNTSAFGQLSPPTVQSARPLGAAPGETVAVEVAGTDLDGATALSFETPGVRVEGLEPSKTTLRAKVTLPADAPPGPLRFRVVGPRGQSNAGQVFVGRALPTVAEVEPNNGFQKPQVVKGEAVAVEGKIEPGNEVDVYAIDLKAGETLAAEVIAARAGSGLDALITLFGPDFREIAEDDDTFGQDAAVSATAKVAGRYFVQVQDADGKNRDDKVEKQKGSRPYRLEMGTIALATSAFPAGLKRGGSTTVRITGANMGGAVAVAMPGDTPTGDRVVRVGGSNGVWFRVSEADEVAEVEPNDSEHAPQTMTVPAAVNGRLDAKRDGDLDVYRLVVAPGNAGTYRVSALASRLGSPADPVLTVLDEKGDAQAENDDAGGRDARVERVIDAKGLLVAVRDYYGRGGPRFVYRLEVEPIPDRCVTVTADLGARVVPRGGSVALAVGVERRGYDGPVTVLAGETPAGVSAVPVTIAKGSNAGVLLVSAADDAPAGAFPFRLAARDAGAPAEVVYRERAGVGSDSPKGWLVVTERAALGVRVEPGEVTAAPGGSVTVKVVLDRRNETAKKAPVKVKLVAAEGNLEGFEPVAETTLAVGSDAATLTLKAKPNAAPARRTVAAVAYFNGVSEVFSVASGPVGVAVGGK